MAALIAGGDYQQVMVAAAMLVVAVTLLLGANNNKRRHRRPKLTEERLLCATVTPPVMMNVRSRRRRCILALFLSNASTRRSSSFDKLLECTVMEHGFGTSIMDAVNKASTSKEVVVSTSIDSAKKEQDVQICNVRGDQKLARAFPYVYKKRITNILGKIKTSCNRVKAIEWEYHDYLYRITSSLEARGGVIWTLREDLKLSNRVISVTQARLQEDILRIQANQLKILGYLENQARIVERSMMLHHEGKEHVNALQHIVPELKSTTNNLNGIAKAHSWGALKIKVASNKLKAITKCHSRRENVTR